MESMLVFIGGLALRFLFFVLLFALFAVPIALVIYAAEGVKSLRARARGTVDAGGVFWKPSLAYAATHAWVKRTWGRGVKVGLDDVARRILAGVSDVMLPPVGAKLRRGDMLAAVRCGERLVAIPSPVDGVVIARNAALMARPGLLEREPYGGGWMVRVEATERVPDALRKGASARTWLRDENVRLGHFMESRLGLAAADGGTLTAPPASLLTDAAWREATELFLRAA